MLKGQIKYYILLIASITGIVYLAISYAEDTPPGTKTYDTAAYKALNDAQGIAKTADSADKDSADATRKNSALDFPHQIADNTYAFLKAFNYFSLNWLQIYTVPSSVELDPLFENYGKTSDTNQLAQLSMLRELYSTESKDNTTYFKNALSADTDYASLVQNINAETGKPEPIAPEIKTYAKYFVKNASGLSIPHNSPYDNQGNDKVAIKKYISLYNTMNSIASYNAYVLSEHLVDMQTDFNLTQTQRKLKNYASDHEWVTHVNEELSMGVILRQLLLFTSQMYIISLQSLETQKQLLATMAMTNSLIILNTGNYEKTLYADATRK